LNARHACSAIDDAMMGTEREFEDFRDRPSDDTLRSSA
jgi:hypothetical protein